MNIVGPLLHSVLLITQAFVKGRMFGKKHFERRLVENHMGRSKSKGPMLHHSTKAFVVLAARCMLEEAWP